MSRRWLIIDTSNLAWKAYHVVGSFDQGVIYGVLRQFLSAQRQFQADSTVWCFDVGKQRRQTAYPDYKKTRRLENMPEKDRKEKLSVLEQIDAFRNDVLPSLGFRNILSHRGYEADDLIARTCFDLRNGDTAVVVSSDKDLYQILTPRIWIWNGKKVLTDKWFKEEYGFLPYLWTNLLAIVGGHDDITGIKGVGPIIATSYLQGKVEGNGVHKKGWDKIDSEEGRKVKQQNLPLVSLPYPGTKSFILKEDNVQPERWERGCKKLGLESLVELCPKPSTEPSLSPEEVGMR